METTLCFPDPFGAVGNGLGRVGKIRIIGLQKPDQKDGVIVQSPL